MELFYIQSLVNHKSGGGYSVRRFELVSTFCEYELSNGIMRSALTGIFSGKDVHYLRIGKSETHFKLN